MTLRILLRRSAPAALATLCCAVFIRPALSQESSAPGTLRADTDSLEEIIVTATKRQESIQQIPISVTAITEKMLEEKSAQNFSDYARGVPNLSFIEVGEGRERVAIRGIDSKTGTTTVGYYFDETPIPDSSSVSAVKVAFDPELIDVSRVEVLRGPQGTVFGSGSMGGTIRVIPNAPDVRQYEFSIKDRLSSTEHANGPSETFSGMLNIPLIADKLAVRLVAFGKWESGFIQRQIATPDSHAANAATGAPLDFRSAGTVPSGEAFGGRIALRYQASDALALEASIFSDSQFYRGFQDITTGDQNPGDALVQNFLFNMQEENRNRLTINNLKGTADLGWGDLLVSASYTRRLLSLKEETAAAMEFVGFVPAFGPAPITEEGRDNSATVEARLSSSRSGAHANDPLQWLIGAYYAYQKGWTLVPWIVPGFTDHFGALTGPVAGDNLYNTTSVSWVRQKAIFGEVSYSPVERLKLTVGSRWFDYSRTDSNPQNGLFAGVNSAAPLDPYNYPTVRGTTNSAVYKGSVSWQHTKNLMVYAQASEGFRGPFGRAALPDTCTAETQQLGAGIGAGQVGADKLWNYEAGIKSDWFSNRLRINVSGYRINWTNVQQAVFLLCGFDLTENLGSVRNDGGEVEIEGRVTEALSAGTSIGYVHSALQQDIYGLPGTKGQPLPDVPQMTAGAYVEYSFPSFGPWRSSARTDYSYSDRSLSAYGVGQSFTPDKKAISLLNARLTLQRDNLELALFAQNLLNDVERTALERDVSLNVATRLRYSVNTPRTFGITFSYRR